MADVALLIDWENVYYTLRQHTQGPLPSTLSILQAILKKEAAAPVPPTPSEQLLTEIRDLLRDRR